MLQSWSSTALEQNLCHLRNHWGIEDKTFPWRCFYTNLTDEICVSHDLFSIQTMKHAFGFLHTLFFRCRTCSCNVSSADTTSGPFKAAGIWEVPLWLSCWRQARWVCHRPGWVRFQRRWFWSQTSGASDKLGGIKRLPIVAFGNLFFHQWLNGLGLVGSLDTIKKLWQWWKKIWQENGAAASGPFCQRLLEQLGRISFQDESSHHHDETLLRTVVPPETLRLIQKLGGPQKPGQADAKGPILGVFSALRGWRVANLYKLSS